MKAFKRIASALGVLFLSVAFAALVTYLTTPEEDRPDIVELTESFDADGGRERAIDWDSCLPRLSPGSRSREHPSTNRSSRQRWMRPTPISTRMR